MDAVAVLLCCAIPLVAVIAFLSSRARRREQKALEQFAALLDGGRVIAGTADKGARAVGRWNGVEVSIGIVARMNPPVFLTVVSASRRPSPVAALFVPRTAGKAKQEKPPADAPPWLIALNDAYDAGCAPREAFRTFMDEDTARVLIGLTETEVEVVPSAVNVQRREALFDGSRVVPLLDAAEQLVRRVNAVADRLVGASDEDAST